MWKFMTSNKLLSDGKSSHSFWPGKLRTSNIVICNITWSHTRYIPFNYRTTLSLALKVKINKNQTSKLFKLKA